LALRIDFPSLPEILLHDRGKIMEAQLCIAPLPDSYHDFDLPSELIIYQSDQLNRVLSNLGQVASSTLTVDELYDEETTYLFNITTYLTDELADSYVDPEKGLLIMLPADDLKATFYRLITEAQNQNTKLKIYYLSY